MERHSVSPQNIWMVDNPGRGDRRRLPGARSNWTVDRPRPGLALTGASSRPVETATGSSCRPTRLLSAVSLGRRGWLTGLGAGQYRMRQNDPCRASFTPRNPRTGAAPLLLGARPMELGQTPGPFRNHPQLRRDPSRERVRRRG